MRQHRAGDHPCGRLAIEQADSTRLRRVLLAEFLRADVLRQLGREPAGGVASQVGGIVRVEAEPVRFLLQKLRLERLPRHTLVLGHARSLSVHWGVA